MPYVSFSLKYRPRRFDDVIGQQHVARTLKNAIANDRVAHAYLFTGPRGTGKTSTARIFAAALNCENGPTADPCGTCSMCNAVIAGNAMDVIEMDAASNRGIDDIRDLRDKVKFAPAEGRYKVYILDEAHQLTEAANNALLKTLEEPPAHVVFMLLTTEAHKIIPTIMSRCQHFDFRAITMADIVTGLRRIAAEEAIDTDDTALMAIADAADGAMRDAQSIFDQIVAYAGQTVTVEVVNEVLGVTDRGLLGNLTDNVLAGDVAGCFDLIEQAIADGKDLIRMVEDLTLYMRDLLRLQLTTASDRGLRMSVTASDQMRAQADAFGADRLLEAINTLAGLRNQLGRSSQQVLLVEVTLAQLCRAGAPSKRPDEQSAAAAPQREQQQAQSRPETERLTPTPPPPVPPPTDGAAPEPEDTGAAAHRPPAVVVPEHGPDLDLVRAHWERVHEELKTLGHMPVSAILRSAELIGCDDCSVRLGFCAEFHYGRMEANYRGLVEDALLRIFGLPMTIECALFGSQDELDAACAEQAVVPEAAPGPATPEPTPGAEAQAVGADAPDAARGSEAANGDAAPAEVDTAHPAAFETTAEVTDVPVPDASEAAAVESDAADEQPLSQAQAVAQTLSLFEGSSELDDDEDMEEEPT